MHQNYSQPIKSVSVSKRGLQWHGGFASWLGIIWLYLAAVVIWIFAMIIRMTLNLM